MSAKKDAPDAMATLGTILEGEAGRDAIHVAVMSAVAGEWMPPGAHVGFLPDGTAGGQSKPVGIVDPFLVGHVQPGQRFWLFIYPRQITSLRHVWSHPTIADEDTPGSAKMPATETPNITRSREWLAEYADSIGASYDELMMHTGRYVETGLYWCEGSRFEGEQLPEKFWGHYEAVTGTVVKEDDKWSFFSCSC